MHCAAASRKSGGSGDQGRLDGWIGRQPFCSQDRHQSGQSPDALVGQRRRSLRQHQRRGNLEHQRRGNLEHQRRGNLETSQPNRPVPILNKVYGLMLFVGGL